jgi:large subunit ribosomal protein L19
MTHPVVREFEASQMKPQSEIPNFIPGDTIRVAVRISEGEKERTQEFEGVCIRRKGGGAGETFTVRRVSFGIGIERVFPLHSPRVEGIRVVRRGRVRRAKLHYLRALSGKKARIREARTADGVPLAVVEADRARAVEKAAAQVARKDAADAAEAAAAAEAATAEASADEATPEEPAAADE